MKIVFRADASLNMGSGHVMRCLTLADALRVQGADCHFISREHSGHLLEVIRQRGYKVNRLVAHVEHAQGAIENVVIQADGAQQGPAHAAWLGSTWQADAQETAAILAAQPPDWLVVDHYALDRRWEEALAPHCRQLLVIDDLADRPHRCDLLLDQNLGRQPHDYAALVPAHCQLLIGPHFALLRPEFAALRPYSLQRRQTQPAIRQLLITMGGTDRLNATGQVLQALKTCALPADCRITVVMGLTAPWLQNAQELAAQMPWPTEVVINVNDMARRMADSDLAIGAAGSTSWERCCLGLPTLMVVLAENQRDIAINLEKAGAAMVLDQGDDAQCANVLEHALVCLIGSDLVLANLCNAASLVADGGGTGRVVAQMLKRNAS